MEENNAAIAAFLLLDNGDNSETSVSSDDEMWMIDLSRKRKRSRTMKKPRNKFDEDDLLKVYYDRDKLVLSVLSHVN